MTDIPDYVLNVPSTPDVHTEPPRNYQWEQMSEDQRKALRNRLIESILQVIVQAITGVFTPGNGQVGEAEDQLAGWASDIPILGDIIEAITGILGGDLGDLSDWADNIPILGDLLDILFGGGIPTSNVSVGAITDEQPNLLASPGFSNAESLNGQAGWSWDGTDGRTEVGSAAVVADGTLKGLLSHKVAVQSDQSVQLGVWVKWSGVAATGTAFQLAVREYSGFGGSTEGATTTIDSVASPGASSTWTELSGSYTPPAGVTAIRLRFVVTSAVTAGTVKWDDAEVRKTGLIEQGWVNGLLDSLGGLGDQIQAVIDTVLEAISGIPVIGGLLEDLLAALQNIPFLNILGIGGPGDIGGSVQSTWDNWISGLVGELGTGASLADLFNIGQLISGKAALGEASWDVLGIRNNKSFTSGMLPSSNSSLPLPQVATGASANTFALTQSTAITLFQRIRESGEIGVVRWMGSGVASITDFFVNVWKMDTDTGELTLIHGSANIIADVGSSMSTNKYVLATPIDVIAGEVYGIELSIRGGGTHNVVGQPTWLHDDPDVYPRRISAVRNSGTSAPPSTLSSLTYASNIPFIETATSIASIPLPHSPETILKNTAGSDTYPIPSWANTVEVIPVGAGGGAAASGAFGVAGDGGNGGAWNTATWTRGTHFTGSASISRTVGAGGTGGQDTTDSGTAGGATSASISGGPSLTANGGAGGSGTAGTRDGKSPGNQSYGGVTYVGGLAQNSNGANGNAPGGGGNGGPTAGGAAGGNGAVGALWLRFKQ